MLRLRDFVMPPGQVRVWEPARQPLWRAALRLGGGRFSLLPTLFVAVVVKDEGDDAAIGAALGDETSNDGAGGVKQLGGRLGCQLRDVSVAIPAPEAIALPKHSDGGDAGCVKVFAGEIIHLRLGGADSSGMEWNDEALSEGRRFVFLDGRVTWLGGLGGVGSRCSSNQRGSSGSL